MQNCNRTKTEPLRTLPLWYWQRVRSFQQSVIENTQRFPRHSAFHREIKGQNHTVSEMFRLFQSDKGTVKSNKIKTHRYQLIKWIEFYITEKKWKLNDKGDRFTWHSLIAIIKLLIYTYLIDKVIRLQKRAFRNKKWE
jgi:hypothetical protein